MTTTQVVESGYSKVETYTPTTDVHQALSGFDGGTFENPDTVLALGAEVILALNESGRGDLALTIVNELATLGDPARYQAAAAEEKGVQNKLPLEGQLGIRRRKSQIDALLLGVDPKLLRNLSADSREALKKLQQYADKSKSKSEPKEIDYAGIADYNSPQPRE